jgi:hypothetical protein
VVDPVNVIIHAYVTMTAATAMTIKSNVARIGEIPSFVFEKFFIFRVLLFLKI